MGDIIFEINTKIYCFAMSMTTILIGKYVPCIQDHNRQTP